MRVLATAVLLFAVILGMVACSDPTNKPTGEENAKNAESIFAVEYRDTVVELGANAKRVLDSLGAPKSQQFVASCGEGAGDQWMYDYGSVIVYTVKDGNKETIDGVVLRDDSAQTVDGISIGSSEADMEKAYGSPVENGQKRRYTKNDLTLEFQVDENEKIIALELRVES